MSYDIYNSDEEYDYYRGDRSDKNKEKDSKLSYDEILL